MTHLHDVPKPVRPPFIFVTQFKIF